MKKEKFKEYNPSTMCTTLSETQLIAPCGMNCRVCYAFQREKNKCGGCRADDKDKPVSRVICKIKTCAKLTENGWDYCGQCDEFPCKTLKNLDKRYREKYFMSMILNQELIRNEGVEKLLQSEKVKWTCSCCRTFLCAHKKECSGCGLPLSEHFSGGR